MRLIIEIRDDIPHDVALEHVKTVMKQGKISVRNGINQYCFVSAFYDGTYVATRSKKKEASADSFLVYKDGEHYM